MNLLGFNFSLFSQSIQQHFQFKYSQFLQDRKHLIKLAHKIQVHSQTLIFLPASII